MHCHKIAIKNVGKPFEAIHGRCRKSFNLSFGDFSSFTMIIRSHKQVVTWPKLHPREIAIVTQSAFSQLQSRKICTGLRRKRRLTDFEALKL